MATGRARIIVRPFEMEFIVDGETIEDFKDNVAECSELVEAVMDRVEIIDVSDLELDPPEEDGKVEEDKEN